MTHERPDTASSDDSEDSQRWRERDDAPKTRPSVGPADPSHAAGHFDNDLLQPGQAVPVHLDPERRPTIERLATMVVCCTIVGAIIGVCTAIMSFVLYAVEAWSLGYKETTSMPGPYTVDWRRRIISLVIAAIIAAIIWYLLRKRYHRVPSVEQALHGALMPWWQTAVHVMLQICIIGAGMSLGREAGPRQLGAMIGQRAGLISRLNKRDLHTLVSIGAGAGIAGVYNAPLAGAVFAIEILMMDLSLEKITCALLCSGMSAWVCTLFTGTHTFYVMGQVDPTFSPDLMLFAIPAGFVCGVCGGLFRKGSKWAEQNKVQGKKILWTLPLAGLATGVLAIWLPEVMGNGRAVAQLGFASSATMAMLPLILLSFIAKGVMTLLTIRSGASGGVLSPAIALGASMGCALGIIWMQFAHTNSIGVYALLGAAALLGASEQAPLMAMCLAMEITSAPMNLFVPVCVIMAVSMLSSRLTLPKVDRVRNTIAHRSFEEGSVFDD